MPVYLSVDIGGTKTMWGLVDQTGSLIFSEMIMNPPTVDKQWILDCIISAYEKSASRYEILSVGLTIPGLADSAKGLWVYACFSGIADFPIVSQLRKHISVPIYIDNDVNACSLAEKYFGACKGCDDFVWITVSTGVGGGVFSGGRLVYGHKGCAGEFGHMVVEETDPLKCGCGKLGCLEAQASGTAIKNLYHKKTNNLATAQEVAELAKAGDADALWVYDKAGGYLGKAASLIANVVSPKKIVVGGGVSLSFGLLEPAMKKAFERHVFPPIGQHVEICPTALGHKAGLWGGAALAMIGGALWKN